MILNTVFMTLCALVFATSGAAIARLFTNDPAVIEVVRRLLLLAAVFQTADGVNSTFRGALRGAKDVRAVAIIGTAVAWSCIPTAAYVLGRLAGWGAFGGWCGIGLEKILAAALLWIRWRGRPRGPLARSGGAMARSLPMT